MSNNLTVWGAASPSLQKQYTIPVTNQIDSKLWRTNYSQLQPSINPIDHISDYGYYGSPISPQMGYDGIYRKKQSCNRIPRPMLANVRIDNGEYGPVQRDATVTASDNNVEYVNSEIYIQRKKGKEVYGLDRNYPIKDPHPLYRTSRANLDYDCGKKYDWNSRSWTVSDLPNAGKYPESIRHLDFSKKIDLVDPVFSSNHSGSDAAFLDDAILDELDPRFNAIIYNNSAFDDSTGPLDYERKYKDFNESLDGRFEHFGVSLNQSRSGSSRNVERSLPGQVAPASWEMQMEKRICNRAWAGNKDKIFDADARRQEPREPIARSAQKVIYDSPFDPDWYSQGGYRNKDSIYTPDNIQYHDINEQVSCGCKAKCTCDKKQKIVNFIKNLIH